MKLSVFSIHEIYNELNKDDVSGITYSRGDPLHRENIFEIAAMTKQTRIHLPNKTQWLYTGYKCEKLRNMAKSNENIKSILNNVDVIVDGRFHKELASPDKPWVGSSNQRVINVKESIKQEKVVIYDQQAS